MGTFFAQTFTQIYQISNSLVVSFFWVFFYQVPNWNLKKRQVLESSDGSSSSSVHGTQFHVEPDLEKYPTSLDKMLRDFGMTL
jgi:hypothetical protein